MACLRQLFLIETGYFSVTFGVSCLGWLMCNYAWVLVTISSPNDKLSVWTRLWRLSYVALSMLAHQSGLFGLLQNFGTIPASILLLAILLLKHYMATLPNTLAYLLWIPFECLSCKFGFKTARWWRTWSSSISFEPSNVWRHKPIKSDMNANFLLEIWYFSSFNHMFSHPLLLVPTWSWL